MPGGLLQLVGVGSQNQFVNGNPSMTYFNTMYKRFTNFAMEHFQLNFRGTDLNLTSGGTKTIRCKIPRYADMLHDCYLCVNLPDIYSPISADTVGSPSTATAYQFDWIPNIGYNMIENCSLLINGTAVVSMTGEWMKLLTYLKYNKTKRDLIDEMVGNVRSVYDPANAYNRLNQYPNAIQPSSVVPPPSTPAPSIVGRQLNIPLPFWFCEEIGQALPLVALTEGEVEISITFKNIYQLFTVIDVRTTNPNTPSTYGMRVPGIFGDNYLGVQNFLSPPDFFGNPTNLALQNWNLNPYIEANYIFLTETERAHVAGYDRTYMITQPRQININNQYGLNDVLIPMFNLCTRVVAVFQRTDLALLNQPDNYTNWDNPDIPPLSTATATFGPLTFYTSGVLNPLAPAPRDIFQEGKLIFDGKDRFNTKNANFFELIENYKYSAGDTTTLPGIYQYSFAIKPTEPTQPSGSVNGSMFNKTFFQYTLQVPAVDPALLGDSVQPAVCVVKSTVFNPVPTQVPPTATQPPNAPCDQLAGGSNPVCLPALYQPGQTITVYSPPTNNAMIFQYNGVIYVESYNFLKVTSGTANLVFST